MSGCVPDEDYISEVITAVRRRVTIAGQSRKESCNVRETFAHPKHKTRMNVRTIHSDGKTEQVCREMENYKIDILGISECRWNGMGKVKTVDQNLILFSGKEERHESGVAIILNKQTAKSLMSWQPVNDRIITARLFSKYIKTTIVQVYAPQNGCPDEEKNEFYDRLQMVYDTIPIGTITSR